MLSLTTTKTSNYASTGEQRGRRQDEAEREKGHVPSFLIVTACIWHVYAPTRMYTEFVSVDLGVAGMKKETGQSARNE